MSLHFNIFNVHKQFSLSLNYKQLEKKIDLDNHNINIKERFNEFKTRYNKTYQTADKHDNAYKTFIQSDQLIQLINSLNLSYTLGHAFHSDLSYNEFIDTFTGLKNISKKKDEQTISSSSDSSSKDNDPVQIISLDSCYNQTVLDLEDKNALKTQKNKMKNASPNTKVDWRYFLPDIKDQRDCGACWAFSSIVSVEGLYNIGEFFKKINDNKYKEGNDTIKWDKLINDIQNKDKNLMELFKDLEDKSRLH